MNDLTSALARPNLRATLRLRFPEPVRIIRTVKEPGHLVLDNSLRPARMVKEGEVMV